MLALKKATGIMYTASPLNQLLFCKWFL